MSFSDWMAKEERGGLNVAADDTGSAGEGDNLLGKASDAAMSFFTTVSGKIQSATGTGAGGGGGGGGGDLEGGGGGSGSSSSSSDPGVLDFGSLSRTERFKGFVGLLMVSVFFFAMAFFFLPVVVLYPQKFALAFTAGSCCFMGSFALAQGPAKFTQSVCTRERFPFTAAYVGSMLGTLYACLSLRSYVAVVAFSGVQLCALLWYGSSYVPGGRRGMAVFTKAVCKTARVLCTPVVMLGKQCLKSIFSG